MPTLVYAEKFVESLNLEGDIKLKNWNGTTGNYNRSNDVISLNFSKIKTDQRRGKNFIPYMKSINEYIKMIICHELGHREDKGDRFSVIDFFEKLEKEVDSDFYLNDETCEQLKKQIANLQVQKEEDAWQLGKKYVPEELIENYDLMNEEYVKERREKAEKEIDVVLKMKRELELSRQENRSPSTELFE